MGGMKEEGSPTKILWGLTYVRGGRGGVKKCSKFADKYYKFCGERGGGSKNPKRLQTSYLSLRFSSFSFHSSKRSVSAFGKEGSEEVR